MLLLVLVSFRLHMVLVRECSTKSVSLRKIRSCKKQHWSNLATGTELNSWLWKFNLATWRLEVTQSYAHTLYTVHKKGLTKQMKGYKLLLGNGASAANQRLYFCLAVCLPFCNVKWRYPKSINKPHWLCRSSNWEIYIQGQEKHQIICGLNASANTVE